MDRTLSLLVKFAALDKLTTPLKNIGNASRASSRDLAGTTRELAALERAQGKMAGMKALRTSIDESYSKVDEVRRRIRGLREEIARTDNPTQRMTNALASAERQEARLVATTTLQSTKLQKLQADLKEAGVDVRNFARAELELGANVDRVNGKLDQQRRQADRVADRQRRADRMSAVGGKLQSTGAGATVAGVAVGAPLMAAAGDARSYNSIMTDIGLKTGLTRDQTRAIGTELRRMGPDLAQLPTKLAGGLDTLAGLGLDTSIGMQLMPSIGKGATAFKADVTDLSKVAFANFNNLKVPIKDTELALDAMAKAGNKGGFELKDMSTYFPTLTGRLQALGQTGVPAVSDLSAALQVAFKTTGDAAGAATNIENLLAKMNAKDTIENFSKVGIDLPKALKKAYAEGKTPLEAIAELTKKATGGNLEKLPYIFGDMQAQSGVLALIQNMDEFKSIRAAANGGKGTVQQTFARRTDEDDQAKLDRFNARMEKLKVGIGDRLLPVMESVMDKAGALADKFDAWGQKNPGLANGVVILASAIAGALVIFGTLAIVSGTLIAGWGIMAGVFSGVWTVLSLGGGIIMSVLGAIAGFIGLPVIAVAAIGAALIAAGVLIYTYWDQIKAAFRTGLQWFVGLHTQMFGIGANLVRGLLNGIGSMFGALKTKIVGMGKSAVGWFKGVLGIHSPSRVFQELGGHVTSGLSLGIDRGSGAPLDRIQGLAGRIASTAAAVTGAIGVTALPVAAAPGAMPRAGMTAAVPAGTVHHHNETFHITLPVGAGADIRSQARALIAEIKRLQDAEKASGYGDD